MIVPFEKTWGDEIHIAAAQIINGDEAGQAMPKRVEKTWGYELHYKNDEQYCMKLLRFNGPTPKVIAWDGPIEPEYDDPSVSTSMHFHVAKHETLLVKRGILTLEVIINKKTYVHKLPEGTAWVICPGHIHRLSAIEGPLEIIEASTKDYTDDSVRIK